MVSSIVLPLAILHLISIRDASGHGALIEPPMRSVLWKYGFDTPINYNYAELYCGGFQNFLNNSGRCGVCGDPFQGPYENERGGKYDLGIIARSYPEGTTNIEVKVEITAHHKGYIEFRLCPNDEAEVTQECLDRYPLMIEEGIQQGDPMKFYPPEEEVVHSLKVSIPPNIHCERCVLQWTYRTGNRWGNDPDGKSCLGCGIQEKFINCADISVKSHGTIVNIRFKGADSLPISDHTPNFAEHKHKVGKSQALSQELNGIAPKHKEPSIKGSGTREQLSNNILLHHKAATDTPQPISHPTTPQDDMIIHTREGVTQAHLLLLPEQRISASAIPANKARHSHMQTPILNTDQWTNPIQNQTHQGHSTGRHQPLPGISHSNSHLFPLNEIHMVNPVQKQDLGRHQPHGIRMEVQAMMALTSPQVREFYQRLALLTSLNNSHELNKIFQNAWKTSIERDRATLAVIQSLHNSISNTIHREALLRNVMLTKRQLSMDRRNHDV